jgi:predicted HD phosphohydrolase
MQPAEQVHAFQLFKRLESARQTTPDLLTAALLHDVGKILMPLSIFDRVVIVLGKYFFRKASQRWAAGTPQGLRLPFVVAERHAEWGADLACQAGASQLVVELIRLHHDAELPNLDSQTGGMLAALQAADDKC